MKLVKMHRIITFQASEGGDRMSGKVINSESAHLQHTHGLITLDDSNS